MSIEKFLEEKVSKIKISLLIYLFIYLFNHYLYTTQKIHKVQKIPMQWLIF